jgi:nitroreductase/Pyruvate/2-oxoacid:ferredoxin oxidoreductase delta subunit
MVEITYNEELCKRCGLCAMTCTVAIPQQREKGTIPQVAEADLERCVCCGQCVAICPQGALSHSHFPEGTVTPIRSELLPTYDQTLELMRSRRSKRAYRDKMVEREVIEKVLEAARFAPSGHNEQSTEFVVVQDKKIIQEITALTAKGLARMAMPFRYAIGRMIMRLVLGRRSAAYVGELAPELEGLVNLYHSGTDIILREPPVLILFCADSVGGTFAATNANLAVHNAALAAETVGLGCFYPGFVVYVSGRDDSIARLVGLPETHEIYGALAMGYPRLKFKKWPERNPAKVTWLEAA